MAKNDREIEIKFRVTDVKKLQSRLTALGAKRVGQAFERTVRFESPDGGLEKAGKFIRVRTGFASVVTFKQKVGEDREFKVRREVEMVVPEPKKMEKIIEGLGFSQKMIMEKHREKWELDGTEIVLDSLPFGNYMEIEGDKKDIKNVAGKLGLKLSQGLTQGYWELFSDQGGRGNIVFKHSFRSNLL